MGTYVDVSQQPKEVIFTHLPVRNGLLQVFTMDELWTGWPFLKRLPEKETVGQRLAKNKGANVIIIGNGCKFIIICRAAVVVCKPRVL